MADYVEPLVRKRAAWKPLCLQFICLQWILKHSCYKYYWDPKPKSKNLEKRSILLATLVQENEYQQESVVMSLSRNRSPLNPYRMLTLCNSEPRPEQFDSD